MALEEERKALRANLDDSEARNTKLELLKRSLEGDIQRTKVLLTDKETEVQVQCCLLGSSHLAGNLLSVKTPLSIVVMSGFGVNWPNFATELCSIVNYHLLRDE